MKSDAGAWFAKTLAAAAKKEQKFSTFFLVSCLRSYRLALRLLTLVVLCGGANTALAQDNVLAMPAAAAGWQMTAKLRKIWSPRLTIANQNRNVLRTEGGSFICADGTVGSIFV